MNKPTKKQVHKIVRNRFTNALTYLRFSLKHRSTNFYCEHEAYEWPHQDTKSDYEEFEGS